MDSNKEHLYRRMLKECQDKASKDTIPVIDYLKLITPKNSIDYKLLEDPLYLKHTSRALLIDKLKTLCKHKLKQINQSNKTRLTNTYRYDDFHMRKQVYIRLTTSEDEGYTHCIKRLVPHWLKELALLNNNKLRTVRKSFNQIKDMISWLFIQYNKVIVVRLDFFLSPGDKNKNNLDWLNRCFHTLKNSTIDSYKGYIGYMCGREYTPDRGVHLHCFLFLDANIVKNESDFSLKIGKRWKDISGGYYYPRNLDKNKLPDLGEVLGKIEYWDLERIEKLIVCCKYLIKNNANRDWLIETGNIGNKKLFSCSNLGDVEDLFFQHEYHLLDTDTKRKYRVSYKWIQYLRLSKLESYFKSHSVNDYRKPNLLYKKGD